MRIAALGFVRAAAAIVLLLMAAPAWADNVDTLINQLNNDDSEKVRLSAALNLARLGDPKAILPMAKAVVNDSDKNVRGACAVGLGKLVTKDTKSSIKGLALANLKNAAANDSSDFVKQQAQKAIATIGGASSSGSAPSAPSGGGNGIYVNIGPMSSKTGTNDKKLQAMMVSQASKTLAKSAPYMATGAQPKGSQGFYVDGTLNTLSVSQSGSTATVSCKVSMLLASYPDKSVFGFLNGGANVQASTSASDIALAQEDCVNAVVENLIAKKIVPTICTKATCP